MSKHVFTTRADACLMDVFEIMRDERVRHVPVLEGDRLVGIGSDRDVRSALPSRRSIQEGWASMGDAPLTTPVPQAMPVMPIRFACAPSIMEASEIMCREKVGALPVVDGQRLVGILSAEDILWAIAEGELGTGGI